MDSFPYLNGANAFSLLGLASFPLVAPLYLAAFAMTLKHFMSAPLTRAALKCWLAVSFVTLMVLTHVCVAACGVMTVGYLLDVVPKHVRSMVDLDAGVIDDSSWRPRDEFSPGR